jgi:hypothetical protein
VHHFAPPWVTKGLTALTPGDRLQLITTHPIYNISHHQSNNLPIAGAQAFLMNTQGERAITHQAGQV